MYNFIINPVSRSGNGLKIWKKIEQQLILESIDYISHFTHHEGDATEIARELTSSAAETTIIILGGDGTVSEVISGIQSLSKTTIGYIPTGSSNDFARDLHLIHDPLKALDHILHSGTVVPLDIGEVICFENGAETARRDFVVSCGIGFDAAICHEALDSRIKNFLNHLHLGKLTYAGIALRQLCREKASSCRIYLDQLPAIELPRFHFIATMIHKYEGGGFQFCPDADYTDGLLDICVIGDISRLKILVMLPTGFSGNHLRFKGVKSYRAREVRIVTDVSLPVHTDGESCGYQKEIRMSCKNEQLHMLL